MLDKLQSRKKIFLNIFEECTLLNIPLKTPQKKSSLLRYFWEVSLYGHLIEISQRHLTPARINLRKLSFVNLTLWIVTFLGENPFIWEYVQVLFDSQDFLIWNKKERDPSWMDYGNCSSYKWTSFYEKDLRKKQLHFMLLFQWQYC